uniref:Uncharacterized protein n=1 Tax=Pipistrellus kuhlii TaxID=59472 RepID=A0A7J7SEZ9_PIPKU|nr:hypothetical protein mPipKuh1_009992 [Pipistrellus kuhlii]
MVTLRKAGSTKDRGQGRPVGDGIGNWPCKLPTVKDVKSNVAHGPVRPLLAIYLRDISPDKRDSVKLPQQPSCKDRSLEAPQVSVTEEMDEKDTLVLTMNIVHSEKQLDTPLNTPSWCGSVVER